MICPNCKKLPLEKHSESLTDFRLTGRYVCAGCGWAVNVLLEGRMGLRAREGGKVADVEFERRVQVAFGEWTQKRIAAGIEPLT
jgi:hypothetical protein